VTVTTEVVTPFATIEEADTPKVEVVTCAEPLETVSTPEFTLVKFGVVKLKT
jgi:hypothetical protein